MIHHRYLSILKCRKAVGYRYVLLLFLLLMSAGVVHAASADYHYETTDDGTLVLTGYDGPGGDLVIPAEIDGKPVTAIARLAFRDQENITSVRFPNTMTSIDRLAFRGNSRLTDVYIPASITHMARPVFNRCWQLQNFHVAEGNPSFRSIDGVLFSTYQGSEIEVIRHYPNAREGAYVIPDFVTRIHDEAFSQVPGLTAVTIPDDVTWIGKSAFRDCVGLTEIVLPKNLKELCNRKGKIFWGCVNLKSIVIPDGVTRLTREIFYNNTSLEKVVLPEGLESIGDKAFYGCSSLKEIVIPAGVKKIGGSREGRVFFGCDNLASIYFLGDAPEVTGPIFPVESIEEPIGIELSHDLIDDIPPATVPLTVYRTKSAKGWPRPGERWMNVPTAIFTPMQDQK